MAFKKSTPKAIGLEDEGCADAEGLCGGQQEAPRLCSTLQGLVWTVYVPTLLLSFGASTAYPVVPIYALALHLRGLWLGVAIASISLGRLVSNPLSGQVLALVGVRATMVASFVVAACGAVVSYFSTGFLSFAAGQLLQGFGASLEAIGRMTYCKLVVVNRHRGRMVSILGGTTRLGGILGPALGGWVAEARGLRAPFYAQVPIFMLGATVCALAFPRETALRTQAQAAPQAKQSGAVPRYSEVLRAHWRVLIPAGVAMLVLQFLRGSRVALIPLYGSSMQLGTDQIGYAMTASYLVDSTFFPVVGIVSDRFGRKKSGLPAFVLLSVGLFALTGATSFPLLVVSGMFTGAGNGLSSGLVMTTGTDLAPPHPETPVFLALYSGFFDTGESLAPILIGLISKAASLRAAGVAVCGIGIFGSVWYAALVPESLARGADPAASYTKASTLAEDGEVAAETLGRAVVDEQPGSDGAPSAEAEERPRSARSQEGSP